MQISENSNKSCNDKFLEIIIIMTLIFIRIRTILEKWGWKKFQSRLSQ